MTLFEVNKAMEAYILIEEGKLKSDWEIMRTISYYSLIAHIDKKKSSNMNLTNYFIKKLNLY